MDPSRRWLGKTIVVSSYNKHDFGHHPLRVYVIAVSNFVTPTIQVKPFNLDKTAWLSLAGPLEVYFGI